MTVQALPKANIIYCNRDPIDNCLFVYFRRFAKSQQYSYNLANIASYYTEYQGLMAHWQCLYKDRILDVLYEDLVRNPGDASARIYEFCGLDHDPAAVESRLTMDQIGHWKRYEPFLDSLRRTLGGAASIRRGGHDSRDAPAQSQ